MKKLVIIPAYNERKNILKTVNDVLENAPGFDYVIINDCSSDDTLKFSRENGLNIVNLPINLGIGGAVQTGYLYALEHDYDMAVQFDGDSQHDASFLNDMAVYMKDNDLDMVIGSRFIQKEGFQSSFMRRVGIRYFTVLIKIVTGKTILDPTSGMRLVNREIIKLYAHDYPRDYPEPESVVAALNKGKKVAEVPVIMRERIEGVSSISMKKSIYYMVKVTLAILMEWLRR